MHLLRTQVSQPEVATAFHLPLAALIAPSRVRSYLFRGQGERPYTAVDVTDLVKLEEGEQVGWTAISNEAHAENGERPKSQSGQMEVWGLTGWYLSLLMKVLRVYQRGMLV